MSISKAIYEYLLASERLAGHAESPFASPQQVGHFTCRNRNDAREALRSIIGSRVYRDRRPQDASHTGIVIRTIDVERDYGLAGEDVARRDFVSIAIYCKGENYGDRVSVVADLLCLCLSGWSGGQWGDLWVCECLLDGESSRSTNVGEGSDEHTFERRIDLSIFSTPVTAHYANDVLTAVAVFDSQPGAGTDVRIREASEVPAGRTITTVAWTIRENSDGQVIVSFSGSPHSAVTGVSGVTGTYCEPAINRTVYGLFGSVAATLTITDSSGASSTDTATQTYVQHSPTYLLGLNIARTTYSQESSPFINKWLTASPYSANIGGGVIDENTGEHVSGEVKYSFESNSGQTLPDGTYDVTYTGGATGPASFVVNGGTDTISLTYTGAATGISIIRSGSAGVYEPTAITRWTPGSCFRFMEASRVNEQEYQDNHPWVRVVVESLNTFYHRLISPAMMATMCEYFNKDAWVSTHHLMSDATIRSIAQAFSSFTGTLYVEHSNEIWNGDFPQHSYALSQAIASGKYSSLPGDAARRAAWHADETDRIGELVKDIIPSAVIVVGSWADVSNQLNQSYLYTTRGLSFVDAFAIAPYLGRPAIASIDDNVLLNATDAQIIQYARDDLNNRVKGQMMNWKTGCNSRGVRLLAYELGFHLTKNSTVNARLIAASQSAEGGVLMGELLDCWHDVVGDLACVFQDVSSDAWGHWQYETSSASPRAQKYLDLA